VRTPETAQATGVQNNPFLTALTTAKLANGNKIYDGVEVDKSGAVVAYHIANNHPNQYDGEPTEFARVEAYGKETGLPNILHIMDTERPEQYRGVPYLAQAIEPLLQMRRYTEAEITAAVVQSFFTAFIKTEAGTDGMPFNEIGGEGEVEASRDPNEYEMGPGAMNILEPGEDVTFGSPTHPNTGFDVFMRSLCEQVGAALEIPADLLLMAFNSSYSASRAALLEAWKGFKMRREWLTDDFCRPVYEIWLTEAVARGRISAPGFLTDPVIRQAYLGSEWIGPAQGQLDPTKEVQAAAMAVEHGFSTREAESVKLNGSEYVRNVDKLTVENELLRRANGASAPVQTPPPDDSGEEQEEEE
jgi:lambda family phage portal protein